MILADEDQRDGSRWFDMPCRLTERGGWVGSGDRQKGASREGGLLEDAAVSRKEERTSEKGMREDEEDDDQSWDERARQHRPL